MQIASQDEHAVNGAALRSPSKFRRIKMQIESLVSIVNDLETVKSRRLAIKKLWSNQEKDERRRMAMEAQLRLASLIVLLDAKGIRPKELKQLAACG